MSRNISLSRFDSKVARKGPDECWEWQAQRDRQGYGRFDWYGPWLAHRAAYVFAHGPIPDGMFVLHRCDNPPCVNPAHLWLGTNADNMADMKRKGRRLGISVVSGETHPQAKLTKAQVKQIRSLALNEIVPQKEIARRFDISAGYVSMIKHRRAWK